MTLLFDLRLSHHKAGFGKPCVAAEAAQLVGWWHEGSPHRPNNADARQALPHYYRKAYDRGVWWFDHYHSASPYMTLRDARGGYLNTLYAKPRDFNP